MEIVTLTTRDDALDDRAALQKVRSDEGSMSRLSTGTLTRRSGLAASPAGRGGAGQDANHAPRIDVIGSSLDAIIAG